jgi:hypothetical protein
MSIISIIKGQRTKGLKIPTGGEILWYGDSVLPDDWQIDPGLKDNFVEGVGGEYLGENIESGSNTHVHPIPNTSTIGNHEHPHGGATVANFDPVVSEWHNAGASVAARDKHDHTISPSTTDPAGTHDHEVPDALAESNLPPYKRYYWIQATKDLPVPIGGIILWDAPLANRPEGFNLCDGNTYDEIETPDLRDVFIYGADTDDDVGDSGGSTQHDHEIPDVLPNGEHSHPIDGTTGNSQTQEGGYDGVDVLRPHSHGYNGLTATEDDHVHPMDGNTGSATHLPPYIKLCYLMRTA